MSLTDKQKSLLKNRLWRLNNLYKIEDKDGREVTFKMTPEQLEFFENQHNRSIILKARQLGFTTEVCIIQLDLALWHDKHCALIAHTLPDAERLFRNKTEYAYNRLPDDVKAANPVIKKTTSELVFAKGGSVTVSTSFRGGTLYSLHVSEFGKICAKHPQKAKEIVTGAFEAVPKNGRITLESTAEGRKGYFYEYCKLAETLKIQGKELGLMDWKFFFFSWWQNQDYSAPATEPLPPRLVEYFDTLEKKHNIKTTLEQQHWYWQKEKTLGDDIKREYPSTSDEAFQQTVEGAYYAKQFKQLYSQGRISKCPDNPHIPVNTAWDIGVGDSTAIWFFKLVGNEIHVIDFYENSGEGLRHYFSVLKRKGYTYDKHYGPHDMNNKEFGSDAKSRVQIAKEGFDIDGSRYAIKFEVLPRAGIDTGIEQVREILPRCVFNEHECRDGISSLENYRKEWDDKNGCWKDRPLHDHTSHAADAFRYLAMSQNKKQYAMSTNMRMSR